MDLLIPFIRSARATLQACGTTSARQKCTAAHRQDDALPVSVTSLDDACTNYRDRPDSAGQTGAWNLQSLRSEGIEGKPVRWMPAMVRNRPCFPMPYRSITNISGHIMATSTLDPDHTP